MKTIGIINDDAITGVQYGEIDTPVTETRITAKHSTPHNFPKTAACRVLMARGERTKHKGTNAKLTQAIAAAQNISAQRATRARQTKSKQK